MTLVGQDDSASSAMPPGRTGHPIRYEDRNALRNYMLFYALAGLSIASIWGGAGLMMIPLHVQQIELARHFTGRDAAVDIAALVDLKTRIAASGAVPTVDQQRLLGLLAQFDAARASSLSVVTSIGVFVTMLAQPVVGVLSDQTRSGRGRRAPWIAAGAICSALGLLGMRASGSVPALAAAWGFVGIASNMAAAPLYATVADRVPEEKLGALSAVTGLGAMLGLVLGMVAGGALFNAASLNGYLPFAIVALLFCTAFVIRAPDSPSIGIDVAHVSPAAYLASFTVALRDGDYRWVWIAKVLLMFSWTVSAAFSVYMLQSYVHPGLSAAEAARMAPFLQLAALPGTLIAMVIAGRWSDRTRRRKPFVIGSSILFAVSMAVPLSWPSLPAMFIQATIAGVALGVFLVVDQALFIDVLPDREAAGRDLGMGNLGGNLGQALGPVLAGAAVAASGGYRSLWLIAMIVVLIAALAIVPVKRAR